MIRPNPRLRHKVSGSGCRSHRRLFAASFQTGPLAMKFSSGEIILQSREPAVGCHLQHEHHTGGIDLVLSQSVSQNLGKS